MARLRRWRRRARTRRRDGWSASVRLPSGPMQFSARAMMRAVVVLPTPRTPVSMKACAMRPVAKALRQRPDQRLLADQAGEILTAGICAPERDRPRPSRCRRVEAEARFADPWADYSKPARAVGANADSARIVCGKVERPARPEADSLRLLPSGPDRVGERLVRTGLPGGDIELRRAECESSNPPPLCGGGGAREARDGGGGAAPSTASRSVGGRTPPVRVRPSRPPAKRGRMIKPPRPGTAPGPARTAGRRSRSCPCSPRCPGSACRHGAP